MRTTLHIGTWLLSLLPAVILLPLGWLLGLAAIPLLGRRNKIIQGNLQLAFPERSALWRFFVRLGHHVMLGRFIVDHAVLLHGFKWRVRMFVRIRNESVLERLRGEPVILIAQHFIGLNHGYVRISLDYPVVGLYSPQRNELAEEFVNRARSHFGGGNAMKISNRAPGMLKKIAREIMGGRFAYVLNDLDQNRLGHTAFLPFCAVEKTATQTALPRLAKLTGALVVPCQTVARPFGGYEVRIEEPWESFPTNDPIEDMRRYNLHTSSLIKAAPTQYYWPHRRFKTRPEGEAYPYD